MKAQTNYYKLIVLWILVEIRPQTHNQSQLVKLADLRTSGPTLSKLNLLLRQKKVIYPLRLDIPNHSQIKQALS